MKITSLMCGAGLALTLTAGVTLLGFGVQLIEGSSSDAEWERDAQQLTAEDAAADDWFGFSVAIDGETALMGTPHADAYGTNAGAAYLYQLDRHGTRRVTKLGAEEAADYGDFGYSVALSAHTALVGKPGDAAAGDTSGAAYLYEDDGQGNWSRIARLTASDTAAEEWFGVSVSLDKHTALVGARGQRCTGAAYVFQKDGPTKWRQVAKLISPEPTSRDCFGLQVAIRGDLAVIGACGAQGNAGAAYLFQRDSSGNWSQRTRLHPAKGVATRFFGKAVALSGRTVVVGAPGDLVDGGAVHVFHEDRHGNWPRVAKITAPKTTPFAQFGGQVAIRGRILAVAAPWENSAAGAVYLFARQPSGDWKQVSRLTPANPAEDDWFGSALALCGDSLLVGAKYGHGSKPKSGAVYDFRVPGKAKPRRSLRS